MTAGLTGLLGVVFTAGLLISNQAVAAAEPTSCLGSETATTATLERLADHYRCAQAPTYRDCSDMIRSTALLASAGAAAGTRSAIKAHLKSFCKAPTSAFLQDWLMDTAYAAKDCSIDLKNLRDEFKAKDQQLNAQIRNTRETKITELIKELKQKNEKKLRTDLIGKLNWDGYDQKYDFSSQLLMQTPDTGGSGGFANKETAITDLKNKLRKAFESGTDLDKLDPVVVNIDDKVYNVNISDIKSFQKQHAAFNNKLGPNTVFNELSEEALKINPNQKKLETLARQAGLSNEATARFLTKLADVNNSAEVDRALTQGLRRQVRTLTWAARVNKQDLVRNLENYAAVAQRQMGNSKAVTALANMIAKLSGSKVLMGAVALGTGPVASAAEVALHSTATGACSENQFGDNYFVTTDESGQCTATPVPTAEGLLLLDGINPDGSLSTYEDISSQLAAYPQLCDHIRSLDTNYLGSHWQVQCPAAQDKTSPLQLIAKSGVSYSVQFHDSGELKTVYRRQQNQPNQFTDDDFVNSLGINFSPNGQVQNYIIPIDSAASDQGGALLPNNPLVERFGRTLKNKDFFRVINDFPTASATQLKTLGKKDPKRRWSTAAAVVPDEIASIRSVVAEASNCCQSPEASDLVACKNLNLSTSKPPSIQDATSKPRAVQ